MDVKASSITTITHLAQSLQLDIAASEPCITCENGLGIYLLKEYHSRGEECLSYKTEIARLKEEVLPTRWRTLTRRNFPIRAH
jgi:hypothetical protein